MLKDVRERIKLEIEKRRRINLDQQLDQPVQELKRKTDNIWDPAYWEEDSIVENIDEQDEIEEQEQTQQQPVKTVQSLLIDELDDYEEEEEEQEQELDEPPHKLSKAEEIALAMQQAKSRNSILNQSSNHRLKH